MSEKSLRKLRIRSENIRILLAELIGTFILIVSKILFLYTAVYFWRAKNQMNQNGKKKIYNLTLYSHLVMAV